MPFVPTTFFVLDAGLMTFVNGGLIPVSVYDLGVTGWNAVDVNGAPVAAQIVTVRGAHGAGGPNHIEDLQVQWCGYVTNAMQYSVLPGLGGADVMLTPTMDGCSFGIGHSAGDGTCVVAHANNAAAQTAVNTTAQMQNAQGTVLKAFYKNAPKKLKYVLRPDDYRWAMDGGALRTVGQSSTFGVRNNAHWRFYRHKYVDNMGTYLYYGMARIN